MLWSCDLLIRNLWKPNPWDNLGGMELDRLYMDQDVCEKLKLGTGKMLFFFGYRKQAKLKPKFMLDY